MWHSALRKVGIFLDKLHLILSLLLYLIQVKKVFLRFLDNIIVKQTAFLLACMVRRYRRASQIGARQ
jgi:hypothetical protein